MSEIQEPVVVDNVVATFVDYEPTDYYGLRRPHGTKLVESGSLMSYAPPTCTVPLSSTLLSQTKLSSAQMDAVGLCVQQHEKVTKGRRNGFLVGDGTGVGKTRIAVAVILENFTRGRTKAVFITVNGLVVKGIKREFLELGFDGLLLEEFSYKQKNSVLIITYTRLVKNINTVIAWLGDGFDGVIVFDESQKAKTESTQQAKTVNKLQDDLTDARIIYLSATAASNAKELNYVSRLHLWGEGLPHDTFTSFKDDLVSRDIIGMELLAMELRFKGCYIARSIRFDATEYYVYKYHLNKQQQQQYNSYCELWKKILLIGQHLHKNSEEEEIPIHKKFWSLFYGAQQRFFQTYLCSLKVDKVVEVSLKALANNASVVIGVQTTGEAASKRCDKTDIYSSTCKETIKLFIDNGFSKKKDVREKLLDDVHQMRFPPNCIDEIRERIEKDGQHKVAELTGRDSRICNGRIVSCPGIEKEVLAFQSGQKRVAIVSDAASTGISLHADLNAGNQSKRYHILIDIPWSAERAVQQFGRTNRSNQAHPPNYLTIVTDVPGELRFASGVTAKMTLLGAITQGTRKTVNAFHMERFDLFNSYGQRALEKTLQHIKSAPGCAELRGVLEQFNAKGKTKLKMEKFFNRLLSTTLKNQHDILQLLETEYTKLITVAKQDNTFEDGVEVFEYGRITISKQQNYTVAHGESSLDVSLIWFQHYKETAFENINKLVNKKENNADGFYLKPFTQNSEIFAVYRNHAVHPSGSSIPLPGTAFPSTYQRIEENSKDLWEKQQLALRQACIHKYRQGFCDVLTCDKRPLGVQEICLLTGSVFSILPLLRFHGTIHIAGCISKEANARITGIRVPYGLVDKVCNALEDYKVI